MSAGKTMNKPEKKKTDRKETPRLIAENRRARYDYFIEERLEAGLVLQGWEVKSMRAGKAQVAEAYVYLKEGEAFLFGANITPLKTASTHLVPEPNRTRKLLLNKSELSRLIGSVERIGEYIRTGRLDQMLTKPLPLLLQVCADQFTLRRLGRITQASIVFVWAATYVDWTPARVGVAVMMVLSGAAVFFGLFVAFSCIQFVTKDATEFANAFTSGRLCFSL